MGPKPQSPHYTAVMTWQATPILSNISQLHAPLPLRFAFVNHWNASWRSDAIQSPTATADSRWMHPGHIHIIPLLQSPNSTNCWQAENAPFPIDLMEKGTSMYWKDQWQTANAFVLIRSSSSHSHTSSTSANWCQQQRNASSPISLTVDGITMCPNHWQSANACARMYTSPSQTQSLTSPPAAGIKRMRS